MTATRPDFALNPMAALVVAYNTVASALNAVPAPDRNKILEVNKFSDKATAVKRLNAIIDQAEAAGLMVKYLPNGAIEEVISFPKTFESFAEKKLAEAHARSNAFIANAVANNPELAAIAIVKAEEPASPPPVPAVETASVGGLTTLELSHRIEVLVENPKRKGSRARSVFDMYRTGQTGEEFVLAVIAAGMDRRVALSNLHWDIDHGFIYLGADVEKREG